MKKRILSILLCIVMVVGLLPAAVMADGTDETTRTEKSAASQVKLYSEDNSKVVKTLKSGQQYKIDGAVVAEYKDGVLSLRDYNGGPIQAINGSLTVNVYGKNTISTADEVTASGKAAPFSLYSDKLASDSPAYLLTIVGCGDSASIKFQNSSEEIHYSCIFAKRIANLEVAISNLKIEIEAERPLVTETQGISVTAKITGCDITAGIVRAKSLLNCTVNAPTVIAETVKDCNIKAETLRAYEVTKSIVEAASLVKPYERWFAYLLSFNDDDYVTNIKGNERKLTIDSSTVTLTGSSTKAWSSEETPALMDLYACETGEAVNEAGIVIKNSTVTIKDKSYGIISPMRGVLIENSNVTVDALSVALGDVGTTTYGYGSGKNLYGLHVTGNSQVKLSAKEPDAYAPACSRLGTMALGYVQDGSTPNNTFDLSYGGFVELSTDAFGGEVPAAGFPAALGSLTKVTDGAYDEGSVVATRTAAGYKAQNKTAGAVEDVYTYTVRIEGVKPELTGEITYKGVAKHDQPLTAVVSGAPEGAELKYKWQLKDGNTWTDISGVENARINIWNHVNVGDTIRAVAYDDAYEGQIIGAEKTVEKANVIDAPTVPSLYYNMTYGDKAEVTIDNYNERCEYVYTTSSAGSTWPSETAISGKSFKVDLTGSVQTIYVYARYAETASAEAGTRFVGSSILIPAKSGSTSYATDMLYPEYDKKTPTVYVKTGESIKLKYMLSPQDATSGLPQWKDSYTSVDGKNATVSVVNNSTDKTLTITAGATAGTVNVLAYKDASATYPERWQYGSDHSADGRQINVVIYDPTDIANAPFIKTSLGTAYVYVDDSYEVLMSQLRALDFVPEGVDKDAYTLAAKITTYGTTGSITFADSNEYITLSKLSDAFRITAAAETTGYVLVSFFALPTESTAINSVKYEIATLSVTVGERPELDVDSVKVAPGSLTLREGKSFKLSATLEPAGVTGNITWSSSDPAVASVNSFTGEVTALAVGTAAITATCNGKFASCNVEVIVKECETHTKTYTYSDSDTHLWSCTVCGACGSEKHNGTWTADEGADTHSITCTLCAVPEGKVSESHNWVKQTSSEPAELGVAGHTDYKCSKCGATKSEAIPALVGIDSVELAVTAPAVGGTAAAATAVADTYDVVLTEWQEGEDDVYIGDAFANGKIYTVKVMLNTKGDNVFCDSTVYTVNGAAATVVSGDAESVTLSYTFPAVGSEKIKVSSASFTLDESSYAVGKKIVDIKVSDTNTGIATSDVYGTGYMIYRDAEIKDPVPADSDECFAAKTDYYLVLASTVEDGYTLEELTKDNVKLGDKTAEQLVVYGTNAAIVFKLDQLAEPVHTHSYTDVVTAPTCTEKGYTTHSCSCGDSYKDSYVDELGHKTELKNAKVATETETGYTGDEVCTVCGTTVKTGAVIPATGAGHVHSYTDKVTTPTCTDKGYTTHTCSCGDSYKDSYVDAVGHKTEIKNAKAASCTEAGYTGDEVCKTCGTTVKTGTAIAALGHDTELKNDKAATCTEAGYTGDEVCKTCGETVKAGAEIAATGHDTELKNAKAATCTEAGYTGDEVCKTCGETVKAGTAIAALGHDTETKNAKAATCTEAGYTGDEVCKTCGETVKTGTVIAALGHKTELKNTVVATETEAGYTGDEVCTVCGTTVKTGTVIPATGAGHVHSYTDKVTAPTCTDKGYTTHTCSCGDSYKDSYVDAVGHDTELKNVNAASCTEAGYTGDEVCKTCGATVKTGTATAALGHSYKDGTCTVCGMADPDYKEPTPAVLPGDINGDGKVNILDLVRLKKHLAGVDVELVGSADVNGDGTVNILDLVRLKKYLAGASVELVGSKAATKASAPLSAQLVVSTETAKVGDEVTVSISTKNNPGVLAFVLGLDYDSAKLEYLGCEDGELTGWEVNNGSKAVWIGDADSSFNGVILKLKFKVLDGASGTAKVSVTCAEDGAANYNEELVAFATVAGGVEIEAAQNPTPAVTFTDVPDSAYYAKPVAWAVDKGITGGYSDGTFKPMAICTRAQIVTFLWRANNSPEPAGTAKGFTDVKEGTYYYKAVLWAAEQGITGGFNDGGFHPDEYVTRAQAMTFLWRANDKPAVPEGTVNSFKDVPETAYYHDAVLWAVANGVTGGYDATTFGSMDGCTRAQIVTFLYRSMA